ncbi:MAG: DUF1801 domain-containing protein [Bacteroidia bacterium]|nr:DUF1801 domain-containing protein [Bacteroidia bacterium]
MAKNKTMPTEQSVADFINQTVENEQKKKDSFHLLKLMSEISGHPPKMWGPSIIGFGSYHYKYPSGHEGDAPILGFSPRKAAISLYVFTGLDEHLPLLQKLGKFKMGKACIYVKKLSDINEAELANICRHSIDFVKRAYRVEDKKFC